MKKALALTLVCLMMLAFAACSEPAGTSSAEPAGAAASSAPESSAVSSESAASSDVSEAPAEAPASVTVQTLNGEGTEVDLEVPYNAERIAVMDLAALDMLDTFGLGDKVVGVSKGSSIDYLQSYITNDALANLGTIKEADLEALMSCEPDLIFIGGRLSAQYDEFSAIAPVVYLGTDTEIGVVESVRKNAMTIASMFGVEEMVEEQLQGFDSRVEALKAAGEGKSAVVGMCTSGSFNTMGNDGRCSIIGKELGFDNLADGDVTSTHGNESSFELLVELNPDYIFVMDRDAAIGTDGAQLAQEIMENELVMKTAAYENGNIVYLEHPAVWYTAEGGIHALDVMLSDLESALLSE